MSQERTRSLRSCTGPVVWRLLEEHPRQWWTVEQAAWYWGISSGMVRRYLSQGRVVGAIQGAAACRMWLIPRGLRKPADGRKA